MIIFYLQEMTSILGNNTQDDVLPTDATDQEVMYSFASVYSIINCTQYIRLFGKIDQIKLTAYLI